MSKNKRCKKRETLISRRKIPPLQQQQLVSNPTCQQGKNVTQPRKEKKIPLETYNTSSPLDSLEELGSPSHQINKQHVIKSDDSSENHNDLLVALKLVKSLHKHRKSVLSCSTGCILGFVLLVSLAAGLIALFMHGDHSILLLIVLLSIKLLAKKMH